MARLKLNKKKRTKPALASVNNYPDVQKLLQDKTLEHVDAAMVCDGVGIDRITGEKEGKPYDFPMLILETPLKWYEIPFSKKATEEIEADDDWFDNNVEDMIFYLTTKASDGSPYLVFGMPNDREPSENYRQVIGSEKEMADA